MWRHDATTDSRERTRDGSRGAAATRWMLVAVIAGVGLGRLYPDGAGTSGFHASDLTILSTLFLRMVKST